jgi:HJR/Mrr/RecB family endonuclease
MEGRALLVVALCGIFMIMNVLATSDLAREQHDIAKDRCTALLVAKKVTILFHFQL